jgi:hypothetical protein
MNTDHIESAYLREITCLEESQAEARTKLSRACSILVATPTAATIATVVDLAEQVAGYTEEIDALAAECKRMLAGDATDAEYAVFNAEVAQAMAQAADQAV